MQAWKSSAARRAQVVCWVGWQRVGFGVAQLMHLLRLCSPALLIGGSVFGNAASPGGAVLRWDFPGVRVNAKALQRDFQRALEALFLPTLCVFAFCQFTVEESLGEACVLHMYEGAYPNDLGSPQQGMDTWQTSLREDICVRNFVLPVLPGNFQQPS
ncbi:hypothetical protein NDU88_005144 [Pleurodeles waltl]|uniref:Uncharacterized protein n=1 Tax=Pleurodeles waltl TaxID=8319 RepID=A0AAV7TA53_PLEWA|nr:hypothetical protein NDU88_005144 [Pleurodeles waltl]